MVIAGKEVVSLEAVWVVAGCVVVDRLTAEPTRRSNFCVICLELFRELHPGARADVTSHSCLLHVQLCEVRAPLGQVARCLVLLDDGEAEGVELLDHFGEAVASVVGEP